MFCTSTGPEACQRYLFSGSFQSCVSFYPVVTLSVCWSCSNVTKRTNSFSMLHQEMSDFVGNITSNVKILLVVAAIHVELQL